MSKQNQIKDLPQNSCGANRVVIMNMDKSIQHWTFTGFKYSKTPYIRAEVLRTISLKFDNSFRIKLCIGSLNEPTPWLTMADLDKMLTGFRV